MAASLRASSLNSNRSSYKLRYGQDRRGGSQSRRPRSDYHFRSSPLPQPWHRQYQSSSLTSPSTSNSSTPFHTSTSSDYPRSITMERTPSGSSISSDAPYEHHNRHTLPSADTTAAQEVERRLKRLPAHTSNHARILHKLLSHTTPLDDLALSGILTAVDSIFFANTLAGRVKWEWSSQPAYHSDLIGATALRECTDREGVETLVVLSEPILLDPKYDRKLLLSTFLHELIHCYLFVNCGVMERIERGHTDGFHRIAKCIDRWVGVGKLRLCSMMANLESFRTRDEFEYDDFEYDEPEVVREDVRFEEWNNVGGCVLEAHRHEGCNQSPRYEREYDDVDEGYEYDSGYVNLPLMGLARC